MVGFELPPFNSGGLGEACLGLTKSLSKNVDIIFLLPKKLPLSYNHMKIIFADERKINTRHEKKSNLCDKNNIVSVYSKNKISQHLNYFNHINNKMINRAKNEKFDLIHAHDWMSVKIALKLKKIKKIPLVLQIHSTEIDRSPLESIDIEKYKLEKYGMENADIVIAVSEYTKKIIQDYYNIPNEKIEVVYNGSTFGKKIQKTKEKLKVTNPIILFVGRLTFQKGINQLLKVAKYVTSKVPNAIFVIAGDGDMYHEAIEKSCELDLIPNILFSGFVRDKEREILYNSADVFIMPSISEPFGLVALEAANFKIPSVISKQSGVGEVLEGARLVDFWDTEKMGGNIIEILKNKKIQKNIVKEQNKSLKRLNWDNAATKCIKIYNKL